MVQKHTPGPWRVTGQSEGARYITVKAASGRTVARVPWNRAGTPLGEITDDADSRLIAAAPEMLAALRQIAGRPPAENGEPVAGELNRLIEVARSAIAKAEGV